MAHSHCLRLIALSLLVAGAAAASPERKLSPEENARARELYSGGAAAFRGGMYHDAEIAFREVYHFSHSPELFYDIALCLERQRKWGPAADTFAAYLKESRRAPDRKKIEARIADLRGRASRQADIDAATARGEAPPPEQVSTLPGNQVMKLGETEQGLLGFGEAGDAAPEPAKAEPTPVYKKWWLWTAVGGGAAVILAVGVGAGVAASSRPGFSPATFPDFGPGASSSGLLQF